MKKATRLSTDDLQDWLSQVNVVRRALEKIASGQRGGATEDQQRELFRLDNLARWLERLLIARDEQE